MLTLKTMWLRISRILLFCNLMGLANSEENSTFTSIPTTTPVSNVSSERATSDRTKSENLTSFFTAANYSNEFIIVEGLPFNDSATQNTDKAIFPLRFTTIENGKRDIRTYYFNKSLLERWPAFQLQIYGETEEKVIRDPNITNYPLHVVVHWHGSVKSWEIPIEHVNETISLSRLNRYANHTYGKTLWAYPERYPVPAENDPLSVDVSIVNNAKVFYKIRIVSLKTFEVEPNKVMVGETATNISPTFYRFIIPKNWSNVFIHAVSNTNICTILSVQRPKGPFLEVNDHSKDTQFKETFTKKAGLTVDPKDFPEGFILAFIPLLNDEKCVKGKNKSGLVDNPFRVKIMSFQIREGKSPFEYYLHYPLVLPLAIFFVIATMSVVSLWFFHHYRIKHNKKITRHSQVSLSYMRNPQKWKYLSNITIDELIITSASHLMGQSYRYCPAGFVTSAFYSVPVFQLIFTFKNSLSVSGDYDICYFNHFCSYMVWGFHDFNHIYSNIWYILFGLLYISFVFIRRITNDQNYSEEVVERTKNNLFFKIFPKVDGRQEVGVIPQYGLLLCIGYAMIMTGIMSAGYHICPNQSNFQFDTIFMYTIAAVTVVTIYQARHPIYLSANFTFTALAMVTIITVLGLLWKELYIRILFSVVHMGFLLLSLPKVWYNGYVRKNGILVAHWNDMMKILLLKFKDDWKNNRSLFRAQSKTWFYPEDTTIQVIPGRARIVLPIFLLTINSVAIACTWTVLKNQNFATQVLGICVMNGALYIFFYFGIKIFHKEWFEIIWFQPMLYLLMACLLWVYGLIYFFDVVSTWEASPAESRLHNKECLFLSFYDSHDMWHFLSAAALYCSAMVLLTIDDDLLDRPKSTIPVF